MKSQHVNKHGPVERVLIASLGSIGRRHLRNLRTIQPSAKLAVLRRWAPGVSAEGADVMFHEISSALDFRPDAAIVASPATEHLSITSALVRNGIPVLVEKPFAEKLDGLPALVCNARARGVPLFVAYNLRFHPLLTRLRDILSGSVVGRVLSVRVEVGQYLPDWRPNTPYQNSVSARRDLGGGALLELSHELDYIYWLFGRATRVFASGGQLGDLDIDVEDTVSLTLRYSDAAPLINIHLDLLQRAVTRQVRISGTDGSLNADLLTGELRIFRAATGSWTAETLSPMSPNQPYLDEVHQFLAAAGGGEVKQLTSGLEAIDIMCLIEAARRSMAERKEVEINYA